MCRLCYVHDLLLLALCEGQVWHNRTVDAFFLNLTSKYTVCFL